MRKNKLLYLLASLPKRDQDKFRLYLSFKATGKKQYLLHLYDFLIEKITDSNPASFSNVKSKAYKKLRPKADYDAIKMRGYMSNLYKLLEDFLAREEIQRQPLKKEALLREYFKRHQLPPFLLGSLKKSKKLLDNNEIRDRHFFLQHVELGYERYFNTDNERYAEKKPLEELQALHYNLDLYYSISKLAYGCNMLATQRIRGAKGNVDFMEEVVAYASQKKFDDNKVVRVYLRMYQLLEKPDSEGFYVLKQSLFDSLAVFRRETRPSLLILLINICWFSCAPQDRVREIFELYLKGLETGVLMEDGVISKANFNNIVDAGCTVGEFDSVERFLADYLPFLQAEKGSKENVKKLYIALLSFGKGQPAKALVLLNCLEFKDFSYGLRTYSLQLQCIYEMEKARAYKQIDCYCRSFKQYVKRKYKGRYISKAMKEEYLNFIKIIADLPFAVNGNYGKITKTKLEKKLLAMRRVHNRTWLMKKIKEI